MCPSTVVNILEMAAGDLGLRELDQRNQKKRSQKQAFIQRFMVAMFGGAALIGPMSIMTSSFTQHQSDHSVRSEISICNGLGPRCKRQCRKGCSGCYCCLCCCTCGTWGNWYDASFLELDWKIKGKAPGMYNNARDVGQDGWKSEKSF